MLRPEFAFSEILTQKIALYKEHAEFRISRSREIAAPAWRRDRLGAGMGRQSRANRDQAENAGRVSMKRSLTLAASAAALVTISVGALAASGNWFPYKIEVWEKAFDMASPRHMIDYSPLDKASQKWKLCASFPHM